MIDSRTGQKDRRVRLAFVTRDMQTFRPNLQLNRTYLAAIERPGSDGSVKTWAIDAYSSEVTLKLPTGAEACVLFAVPSVQTELKPGGDMAEAITMNLAESLFMPRDDAVRAAVKLLVNAGPVKTTRVTAVPREYTDYGKEPPKVQVGVPNALSRRVEQARNTATGYRRSKVAELLVRWRMSGSVRPYVSSLIPLLKVPTAYADPESEGQLCGLLLRLNEEYRDLDGTVGDDPETELRRILAATNPRVLEMWLMNFGGALTEPQIERFAQLLRWDDRKILFMTILILSSQLGEPGQSPRLSGTRNGVSVPYPDLAEKRAYWMKRFKIAPGQT